MSRAKLSTIGPPESPLGVGDTAETPVDVLTFRRLGCRNPIMPGAAETATFVYTRGAGRSVFPDLLKSRQRYSPRRDRCLIESSDMTSAIVGGLIGAFAGGIPAWALAKRQSNETLRRDREQRVENQKALAFSVVVKLLHVINSTVSLSNHVKSCLALRDAPDRAHMEPWQVLVPMIGYTDEGSIRFTADEMAVFAAANEYDFMQDMMLLTVRHSSSLATFQEYCVMRNEFRAIGPKPQDFDGQIGGGWLTQEEADSYKPYTIPMNNVVVGLDAGLDEDVRLARTVAERFGPVTAKHFEVAKFADLTFPSDDELAAMRQPPNPA